MGIQWDFNRVWENKVKRLFWLPGMVQGVAIPDGWGYLSAARWLRDCLLNGSDCGNPKSPVPLALGKYTHNEKNTQTFLGKKCLIFHISQNVSLRIDKSTTMRSRHRKPKSNVFPLNILCVFFILTLEKERARWLKTHNLL